MHNPSPHYQDSRKKYSVNAPLAGTMLSPTALCFTLKIILITTGAVSIAVALKSSVPGIIAFSLYDVPILFNSLLTWLKPPYLYFIINGIIITIAASSMFNHRQQLNNSAAAASQSHVPLITAKTPPASDVVDDVVLLAEEAPVKEVYVVDHQKVVELKPVVVNGIHQLDDDDDDDDDGVADNDTWIIPRFDCTTSKTTSFPDDTETQAQAQQEFVLPVKEKTLVLSRFGHHHSKPAKTNPLEGAKKLARTTRQQNNSLTLESAWKMITEEPLRKNFKKSDTWENHGRELVVMNSLDLDLPPPHVPKFATFRHRTNNYHEPPPPAAAAIMSSPSLGKIKKELSLSQDELNHRVEDFIKKFNEEMRLQRQESLNQYTEMIHRGAY